MAMAAYLRSFTSIRPLLIVLAGACAAAALLACGSAATPAPKPTLAPTAAAAATAAPAAAATLAPTAEETAAPPAVAATSRSPVPATSAPAAAPTSAPATSAPQPTAAADENPIRARLATTVLELGQQRVAFLLADSKGIIQDAAVTITPVYSGDNSAGPTVETEFHLWPYGSRGSYTADVLFDRPGEWRLDVDVAAPDVSGRVEIEVNVEEQSPVPGLGAVAPMSHTKTLGTVADIEKLTTDYSPDPDLYQLSIAEAIENSLPSVIVFASPAFCTTATCGPQVDAVSELKNVHQGKANFIHVEIYDNPDEIQGDLSRGEIAPSVDEWGLSALPDWFNESWTFVLDDEGRVRDRFEGFASYTELEDALTEVLAGA